MSEMKTARPRIPSPFDTAGIFTPKQRLPPPRLLPRSSARRTFSPRSRLAASPERKRDAFPPSPAYLGAARQLLGAPPRVRRKGCGGGDWAERGCLRATLRGPVGSSSLAAAAGPSVPRKRLRSSALGLPPEAARIPLQEQEQVLILPRLGGGNGAQNAASARPLMRNKSA